MLSFHTEKVPDPGLYDKRSNNFNLRRDEILYVSGAQVYVEHHDCLEGLISGANILPWQD